jgi:hypothetical protein
MQHMNWYMRSIASQGALRDFAGWSRIQLFQKNWGRSPHDAALHRLFVLCSRPGWRQSGEGKSLTDFLFGAIVRKLHYLRTLDMITQGT